MSTKFPAPNFLWPICGEPRPVLLQLDRGRNNQLKLHAISFAEGYPEPWGEASVVPSDSMRRILCSEPDTLYIKNYSENVGVLEALIAQGYAEPTGEICRPDNSFCEFPKVRLTAKGRALNPALFSPS